MKKTIFVGVVFWAILILLSGCQNNTATPKPLDHVTLRLNWQPGAEHVAYYLAQSKGFYEAEGLDVEIVVGSGSADSVKFVASGDVDFSLAAGGNVIQGVAQGMPLVVIGVIYQDDPTSFTVLQDSGIENLDDLVGKKIGVALNSSTYPEYVALMETNNIDRSQVTEVPVSFGIEPLLTQQVDAFPGFLTQIPLLVSEAGQTPHVIAFKDYGINIYGISIITRQELVTTNPDMVGRFVRATFNAWQYVFDHRSEAVSILEAKFPELNHDKLVNELDLLIPLISTDLTKTNGLGYSDESRWADSINILYAQDVIGNMIDPDKLFTNQFIVQPKP